MTDHQDSLTTLRLTTRMSFWYPVWLSLCLGASLCMPGHSTAQSTDRWILRQGQHIVWPVKDTESHMDHLEMSGFNISAIVHYGVEKGRYVQRVHLVFPMLRTLPNDTHASLARVISYDTLSPLQIAGRSIEERPDSFWFDGMLHVHSTGTQGLSIRHHLYPSRDEPAFIDRVEVHNPTQATISLTISDAVRDHFTDPDKSLTGSYRIRVQTDRPGRMSLAPGETREFALIYSGGAARDQVPYYSARYEEAKRAALLDQTAQQLVLESPDPILNQAFAWAKLRAVESIYRTRGGLMHGPGGGRYYAAIWANDQAEYANPFFPFLGDPAGVESARNSFRHFARYMNPAFQPIPSSIIAEGTDDWHGAGDRGDMAMIAYGAARFALAQGDPALARELWPLITWCLEYCRRQLTQEGVVRSDSDELEGRFPAGDANLNTSCLYLDALRSAGYLGQGLGEPDSLLSNYASQANDLEKAIEAHFGRTVSGYETYRYYAGNETLRAWICTPLTVDIFTRKEGTMDALFSALWTPDGLASAAGSTTFWDRATLYALRGVMAAGETERALAFLQAYSRRRLLGEHVPYPVEAWPEGNQRHLSAESALYCRIITEGLFHIRPTGFHSFDLTPHLPAAWDRMTLRHIRAFGRDVDLVVERVGDQIQIQITEGSSRIFSRRVDSSTTVSVDLHPGKHY